MYKHDYHPRLGEKLGREIPVGNAAVIYKKENRTINLSLINKEGTYSHLIHHLNTLPEGMSPEEAIERELGSINTAQRNKLETITKHTIL